MSIASALSFSAAVLLISVGLPTATIADTKDGLKRMEPLPPQRTAPRASGAMKANLPPGRVANDPHDLPCPGDMIGVVYEEDANGNPVPGTEEYFCVWD